MFNLTIDLGNEAMQTCDDVSRALLKVAARLKWRDWESFEGVIMDDNGNKVGTWSIEGAGTPDADEDEPDDEDVSDEATEA